MLSSKLICILPTTWSQAIAIANPTHSEKNYNPLAVHTWHSQAAGIKITCDANLETFPFCSVISELWTPIYPHQMIFVAPSSFSSKGLHRSWLSTSSLQWINSLSSMLLPKDWNRNNKILRWKGGLRRKLFTILCKQGIGHGVNLTNHLLSTNHVYQAIGTMALMCWLR